MILAALFIFWCAGNSPSAAGLVSALALCCLFAAVCLRFVPMWVNSWGKAKQTPLPPPEERGKSAKIFFGILLWDVCLVLLVTAVRALAGESISLAFWRCTDSQHYLAIAEDWYLSEGSRDRLVQLVFLPGYPLLVRLVKFVAGDYLLAGMLASAVCFAFSGCVFYKLLRLDMSEEKALRGLIFLCVFPGAFFFAAPMSESLFLLLSVSCVHLARKGRIFPACLLGALAAFTRSVGLALMVPVLLELITQRKKPTAYLALLVIPAGFAAYCLINYTVSGDALKFMEYQREHWNQSFGFFFGTSAYQTDYALSTVKKNPETFFGLWLPNLIAIFGALLIMLGGAKRLRPSYTAYFLAYYFVAVGATWLLSAPRYMLVMFPLAAAMAEIADSSAKETAAYAVLLVLGLAYLAAFALRWQVW